MKTVAIACKTLEEEIRLVLRRPDVPTPELVWIESGLHNTPEKLRARLQRALDEVETAERVLLVFGICGNAALYLKTGDFEMIMPRVDDCITLMLGSFAARSRIAAEGGTYFLTQGWMQNESNIYAEYLYAVKKYGKRTADSIYKTLLAHYRQLGLIDTGAYDFVQFVEKTKVVSETLGLAQRPITGTLEYLAQLFTGPWPAERFIAVPKNTVVSPSMLDISGCS